MKPSDEYFDGYERHMRNLGYVPPEFSGKPGEVQEDPDELGYFKVIPLPDNIERPESLVICNQILSEQERADLVQAALLAHKGCHDEAAEHRLRAGYGGCDDRLSL